MFAYLRPYRLHLVLLALFAFPVLTYWDTIFAHFGLRDDYSVLREVREEPGKVMAFCASHARPIFGWISEQSLRHLSTIEDLAWARLWAALCAGLVGAGTAWVLAKQLHWRMATAALVGALVVLLPGTQVLVGWAICWGHLVGLIFGIAGFAVVERGLQSGAGLGARLLGLLLVAAGALTYQSNVLFYVVFIAAALPMWRGKALQVRARWLAAHLGVLVLGLATAFAVAKVLFATGVFTRSERVAFEQHPGEKLLWFLHEPLGNALSFLVINDDHGRTAAWHLLMAMAVVGVIGAGLVRELRRYGWASGAFWAVGLAGLPILAYSVSLMSAEQWSTYRTIFALTGVLLMFFVHGLNHLAERCAGRWELQFTPIVLSVLVACGFVLARDQAYHLIAEPQIKELSMIEAGARQISPSRPSRVFVVTPDGRESFAELTYADEFGSLSTASGWTPKEMLLALLRERYPSVRDVRKLFTFDTEQERPEAGQFDVVIDLNAGLGQEKTTARSLLFGASAHEESKDLGQSWPFNK